MFSGTSTKQTGAEIRQKAAQAQGAQRLQVNNIVCAYNKTAAVQGLSLEVRAGEVLCLLGASGCGKTTTLRAVAGVERPVSGEIRIDGELVFGAGLMVPPESRHVGLMFQDYALFPHMTVLGNVMFGLKHYPKRDRKVRAMEALASVHMDTRAKAYPHMLSGGEQQRVGLARALAPEPAVLLMDEPFSGLDKTLRDSIRKQALKALKASGAAVLLVTHDPEEALRAGDRIAVMQKGKILQCDTPEELQKRPADAAVAALFGHNNVLHSFTAEEKAKTPLGVFGAPGINDGTEVEVFFRPTDLQILASGQGAAGGATSASATVRSARMMGDGTLVELTLDQTGEPLEAMHFGTEPVPTGAQIEVRALAQNAPVFPCMKKLS